MGRLRCGAYRSDATGSPRTGTPRRNPVGAFVGSEAHHEHASPVVQGTEERLVVRSEGGCCETSRSHQVKPP